MSTTDWTALNHQKERGRLWAALVPLDPEGRAELLNTYLEQQVVHLLKADGRPTDRLKRSFLAIGFDSLMSVDLLYHLQRDLDRDLDPEAMEQDSIDSLAAAVLRELGG